MRPPDDVAGTFGLTRRFVNQAEVVLALDGVTMTVRRAALTVIVGPSGSGKSTLLGQLACIDRPSEGSVTIEGIDVGVQSRRARRELRRRRLGVVLPQPSDNLLDEHDAVGNIRWAARQRGTPVTTEAARAQLDLVGLHDAAAKHPVALSGGEQQRLAVLCAAVGEPLMVLADEPTASLDRATAATLAEVLRALTDRGTTTVVATHDPVLVAVADVVVALDHGRLA